MYDRNGVEPKFHNASIPMPNVVVKSQNWGLALAALQNRDARFYIFKIPNYLFIPSVDMSIVRI